SGNLNKLVLGTGATIGPDSCYGGSASSAVCGDGAVNSAFETCDDKNADACDGCVGCKAQRAFDASATNVASSGAFGGWAADALCPTCETTVEAWVRLDKTPSGPVEIVSSSCGYLSLLYTQGKFGFVAYGEPKLLQSPSADVGKWYHLAGVVSWAGGGAIRLYLDGKLVDSATMVAPTAIDSNIAKEIFWIGGGGHTCLASGGALQATNLFPGVIDEVRVSQGMRYTDDFLPPKRLRPDRQTRGLWHFDEPAAATSYSDDSGQAVSLTPNKAAWTNDMCWGQTGAAVCGDAQPAKYEACDFGSSNGPPPQLCSTTCTPKGDADCDMLTWGGTGGIYNAIMFYGTPWTVEGWVKLTSLPAAGTTGWIVGVADSTASAPFACGQPAKQEWYVATAADGTDASQLGGATQTSSTPTKVWRPGVWQHFAIQYEGLGRGSLWVDGYKARTFGAVSTAWQSGCVLLLGNSSTGKASSASLASLRFSKSVRYGQPFTPAWKLASDNAATWRFEFTDPGAGVKTLYDTTGSYKLSLAGTLPTFVANGPQCK
ncbi:MAG: hypothetical protein HY902_20910, partial [Deltaproteobacteria bacterium]|nr:hypothetical protein [Deltaproteobacteria bacterium]